jgi:hypothetical protein
MRIALAWMYDPDNGVYLHSGAPADSPPTPVSSARDFAAVVLLNAYSGRISFYRGPERACRGAHLGEAGFIAGAHFGPAAGPIRSFFAYWIAMLAAGVFIFCCVLALQGFAALLLPRRWSLRASAFLQLAVFCLLVSGYFLQRSPVTVLWTGSRQPWLSWIPSYWFVGMYQQLSGSLHPALAPFARRAWIGLAIAVCATAIAYAASYFRTLRKIVEQPDISPGLQKRLAAALRRLIRNRHRAIQYSKPAAQPPAPHDFRFLPGHRFRLRDPVSECATGNRGPGRRRSLGSAFRPAARLHDHADGTLGGRRARGLLPAAGPARQLDFPHHAVRAGRQCLNARRRALIAVSVAPAWALSAAVLFSLWPWRPAAAHLAVLALVGIILAEFSFDGCSEDPIHLFLSAGKIEYPCHFLALDFPHFPWNNRGRGERA